MAEEIRVISMQNIADVIRLLNETSRGTALELHLDFFSFLGLARYWNFSYDYSLIAYVDNEPAAIIVTCIDSQARDAYTFYWGALPKFRTRRTARDLYETCCRKLRDNGFFMSYAVSSPDRPARKYRFVKNESSHEIVGMQSQSPDLPAADRSFEVRRIDVEALAQVEFPAGEPFSWSQRIHFLRNLAAYLHFLGAFSGDSLRAYAVIFRLSTGTNLLDLRSLDSDFAAGNEILRYLNDHDNDYRPPFTAGEVFRDSYAHRLLASAGFKVIREFATLSRDLRTTVPSAALQA